MGQEGPKVLTLQDALRLAKERNGTVRAAGLDIRAADARVRQSQAAFLPTVTPQFQYNSHRREIETALGNRFAQDEGGFSTIGTSMRLLDSGERGYSLRSNRKALEAQRFNSRQNIRSVLFSVQEQYYDALRAQELQRVADTQVERANTILDQTKTRVEVRDAARKDILQATADVLNARVQALSARNRTANTGATLKSTIGLESEEPLPPLEKGTEPTEFPNPGNLRELIEEGLRARPDLLARRRNVEAQRFSQMRAEREANLGFTLDAGFDLQTTPRTLESRTLTFLLSYPLFDGNLRRERAREIGYNIAADRADLEQAERSVRAEVESAYKELTQNADRVQAAKSAVEAARINYAAAVDSQKLGASDLIEVLTAQVSLVTAESNFIEAVYDYAISDVRLKLVTGRPIPGE
jgi:outer membrane protein